MNNQMDYSGFDMLSEIKNEVEASTIAIILENNDDLGLISDILSPSDFSDSRNKIVYGIIQDLAEQKRIFDYLVVIEEIEERKLLDQCSISYVSELFDFSAGQQSERLIEYAKIVKEKSIKAKFLFDLEKFRNIANKTGVSSESIQNWMIEKQIELDLELGKGKEEWLSGSDCYNESMDAIERVCSGDGDQDLLKTGLTELDKKIGGLEGGDLLIIAARPSMGKTALALKIAQNITKAEPERVGVIFSLETTRRKIINRMISQVGRIPINAFKHVKTFEVEEFDKMHLAEMVIDKQKIFIVDIPSDDMDITRLKAICRRLEKKEGRLDFIITDFIQLLVKNDSKMVTEMGRITRGLKSVGKELGAVNIALSQLNRGVENRDNKRPRMSDLRESGQIEQDADLILFIYREGYYDDKADQQLTELLLEKNKDGETGTSFADFHGAFVDFRDRI